jgi:hypothetical protein
VGSDPDADIVLGGIYVMPHHVTLRCEFVPGDSPAGSRSTRVGGACRSVPNSCRHTRVVQFGLVPPVSHMPCHVSVPVEPAWNLGGWYVYAVPAPNASVYVNGVEVGGRGKPAGSRTLLSHGCRVVVGVSHYFRFHNPTAAGAAAVELKDWSFANEVRPVVCAWDVSVNCL